MNQTHRHQAAAVLAFLVALSLAACVTWNGDAYRKLANDELVALSAAAPEAPLDPDRCLALNLGALSLRDDMGKSRSLRAPFFSGQHLDQFTAIHQKQAAVCVALLKRDIAGEVTADQRARSRLAWVVTWRNGRRLLGGGASR